MKQNLFCLGINYLLFVLLLGLFAGCVPSSQEGTPQPIEVTDQLGRVVKLNGIPQRIISLAPSNTEVLFALGLEEKVVAVTDFCDYPPQAKEKPSIGGFSTPNIEEVVAHSPDLILAASIHETRIIPQLEQRGLTVLALRPRTLSEVMDAIILVGEVSGKEKEASELVTGMQNRVKAITDRTEGLPLEQKPKVFYSIWHDPLMAAGSGTLHDELIKKAGGTNIAHELTDYADISLEVVINADPDVMIASVSHGSSKEMTFQFLATESRLSGTRARLTGGVYLIDGNLTSRAGPRLVEGLEMLAEFIHPELFKDTR